MKFDSYFDRIMFDKSLPVREAWIEIPPRRDEGGKEDVAPRKGSVD